MENSPVKSDFYIKKKRLIGLIFFMDCNILMKFLLGIIVSVLVASSNFSCLAKEVGGGNIQLPRKNFLFAPRRLLLTKQDNLSSISKPKVSLTMSLRHWSPSFKNEHSNEESQVNDEEDADDDLAMSIPLMDLRGGGSSNNRLTKPVPPRRTKSSAADANENSNSGASIGASIFNLVNNVAGAGILALPAGQAAGTGWIPSLLICAALGVLSARTFYMIGESCELTSETDFKVSWRKIIGRAKAGIFERENRMKSDFSIHLFLSPFRVSGHVPWVRILPTWSIP